MADPVTGSSASGAISVVDVKTNAVKEIPVGLAPSATVLSPDQSLLVVTNSHSDSISIIDTRKLEKQDIGIPTYPDSAIGSIPNAAAFSPGGKRIYVACGGNNAIAVIEHNGHHWKVAGAIPTGWFPSAVVVDTDGSCAS